MLKQKRKIKKKKRKKNIARQSISNEVEYENENLFLLIMQTPLGQFFFICIVGWGYVILWMNTKYYDHSIELLHQPNFGWAYLIPWVIIFCYMLYEKTKAEDIIGGRILTHVISVLIISFFVVGCSFGMMFLGLILSGLVGILFI